MKKFYIFTTIFIFSVIGLRAQTVAIKTNLLYGAYTFTPNLSVEIALADRSTIDIGGGYNWLNLKGSQINNKKAVHWLGQIEYRYWLCRKFNGHFFGAHLLGSEYNIANNNLPLLFGQGSDKYRYEGWAAGIGLSYGYSLYLSNHWSIEFNIGIGYARMNYDKYNATKCGKFLGNESRDYFGPTKAGISIVYIIK